MNERRAKRIKDLEYEVEFRAKEIARLKRDNMEREHGA